MKFLMNARIEKTLYINNRYTAVVTTPAKDQYSKPSSFKLQSDERLGDVGQECTFEVEVSGFVKENNYKDKQTGESKVYYDGNVYLEAKPHSRKQGG